MKLLIFSFILLMLTFPSPGSAQTASQPSTPKPPITLDKGIALLKGITKCGGHFWVADGVGYIGYGYLDLL